MNNSSSSLSLTVAGYAAVIGVAAVTAFTVNYAINDANNRADAAYLEALNSISISYSQENNTGSTEPGGVSSDIYDSDIYYGDSDTPYNTETNDIPRDGSSDTDTSEDTDKDVCPVCGELDCHNPEHGRSVGDSSAPDPNIDLSNCYINEDDNLVYIVQKGDWLYKIASRFGSDAHEIGRVNNIPDINWIYPKQRFIIIPCDEDILAYARQHCPHSYEEAMGLTQNSNTASTSSTVISPATATK